MPKRFIPYLFKHAAAIKIVLLCLWFCCAGSPVSAQNTDENDPYKLPLIDSSAKIFLDTVVVYGNKKTKQYIILREMKIKPGDSIIAATLSNRLKESQELIYNTNLFSEVTLTPRFLSARHFAIDIHVIERWYIYPIPQFQLTDRNYNEWINRYNANLNRVIYGLKFAHYNISGRRDQLRVYVLNGFARNISVAYSAPYSNRKLTEGFSIGAGYLQSRDVIYNSSSNNLPIRYATPGRDFVRKTFTASAGYLARRGYFKRHYWNASLSYMTVPDSITKFYNPRYFNSSSAAKTIADFGYTFQYSQTNNINYPLTGKLYGASVAKRGLGFSGGINMLSLTGSYTRFLSLGKNWYHSYSFSGNVKLPFNQPYINQVAMGYNEYYLRGLEDYVIDAVASSIARYTLRKKMIEFNIPVPFKNKIISSIPFQFYAKTYADAGYAYNRYGTVGRLNNKLLYTGGIGIDILSIYDFNFSFEYSFNQLGQKGLFLHTKGGF